MSPVTGWQHYTVPHEYAGKLLRVRLTSTTVTVFDGLHIVCEHDRLTVRRASTRQWRCICPSSIKTLTGSGPDNGSSVW